VKWPFSESTNYKLVIQCNSKTSQIIGRVNPLTLLDTLATEQRIQEKISFLEPTMHGYLHEIEPIFSNHHSMGIANNNVRRFNTVIL